VLTIRAPSTPHYWRATVLDRFDGTRWLERVWHESRAESLALVPIAARRSAVWIRQDVTVGSLQDDHLIGASVPVAHSIDTQVRYEGQGVVHVVGGLDRDERYRVWSYAPRPTPSELVRVQPSYPSALTRPGRELDLAPGVTAPPFGVTGRDRRMVRLLTGSLQPYAALYKRARA